jgi:hypothetical protein
MEKDLAEKRQLKKMPTKRKLSIEQKSPKEIENIEGLIDAIEATGLDEFMAYIRSPWKMLWPNFIAGVARGFGALVGATIVIALIGWSLSVLIDLPLIGKRLEPYVQSAQEEFKKYTEATNYKENFENIESTLIDIKSELQKR